MTIRIPAHIPTAATIAPGRRTRVIASHSSPSPVPTASRTAGSQIQARSEVTAVPYRRQGRPVDRLEMRNTR